MAQFQFLTVSGLEKVFPDQEPESMQTEKFQMLRKERFSFQLAWFCRCSPGEDTSFQIELSGLPESAVSVRKVELVPSRYPCHGVTDDNYLTTVPGLLPDLLQPAKTPFRGIANQWRAAWITVDSTDLQPEKYTLTVQAAGKNGDILFEQHFEIDVLDAVLPPQKLYHTEWFHADCLADYYHVPVFSEEHWRIIENFMEAAHRCGVNMLLTPVFTPPLDTAPGGERTTVQLVKISCEDEIYSFDFTRLERWVNLCHDHGISEIEIVHLFTQWGAESAPKIMVKENGRLFRKFGWDTPSDGKLYQNFLSQFLPALKTELQKLGVWEHSWFHISDEPAENQREKYRKVKNSVRPYLEGAKFIDALSSYKMYEEGIVEKPAVSIAHIAPFLEHHAPDIWAYYCTAEAVKVPNRFMAMPSARNRILGVLLYVFEIEGFLHWGFNFYNSQYSLSHINPFCVTDAGEVFPSGDPFLVYPAPDGTAWSSIRSEVLYEAVQDHRLLCLAEEKIGREKTLKLVMQTAGMQMDFEHYPREKAFFTRLRNRILDALQK